jgi:menaquinol-cytochrome c reductase iron-sulfur subunit
MDGCEEQSTNTRRNFFINGLKALTALFGLSLSIPLIGFALSPAVRRGEKHEVWISAARFADLLDHRPTKVIYQFDRKDGWVTVPTRRMAFIVKNEDGSLNVLSNLCPHLGCGVDWDDRAGHFRCPCHGGVFDVQGRVVEGPPPRPLEQLVFKLEDGVLFIREA